MIVTLSGKLKKMNGGYVCSTLPDHRGWCFRDGCTNLRAPASQEAKA